MMNGLAKEAARRRYIAIRNEAQRRSVCLILALIGQVRISGDFRSPSLFAVLGRHKQRYNTIAELTDGLGHKAGGPKAY